MGWIWIIYWLIIIAIPLVMATISIIHKIYKEGILLLVLTLLVYLWNFYFLVYGDWQAGYENEFVYLFRTAGKGNVQSIGILVGYICIFMGCFLNFQKLKMCKH